MSNDRSNGPSLPPRAARGSERGREGTSGTPPFARWSSCRPDKTPTPLSNSPSKKHHGARLREILPVFHLRGSHVTATNLHLRRQSVSDRQPNIKPTKGPMSGRSLIQRVTGTAFCLVLHPPPCLQCFHPCLHLPFARTGRSGCLPVQRINEAKL